MWPMDDRAELHTLPQVFGDGGVLLISHTKGLAGYGLSLAGARVKIGADAWSLYYLVCGLVPLNILLEFRRAFVRLSSRSFR